MAENITPEETPLHEIVLELMFEMNKEKPAELNSQDILWKLDDPTLTQRQVAQVLNWLVNEKRLQVFSEKYSLDRFEFLDQRKKDELKMNPSQVDNDAKKEEIPLHDIILKIMFDASGDKPAELSANDIFWKSSDPSLKESQVTEVLNWLVNQRRVQDSIGKYSLDRFEFLDQKTAHEEDAGEEEVKPKSTEAESVKPKEPKPQETPKKKVKPVPQQVFKKENTSSPKVEAETQPKPKPVSKPVPKKVKEEKKQTEHKKEQPKKEPAKTKEVVVPKVKVEQTVVTEPIESAKRDNLNSILLVIAGIILVYSCYLCASALNDSVPNVKSRNIETEIATTESRLNQISGDDANALQQKIELLEEISKKRSVQLTNYQHDLNAENKVSGKIIRLGASILLLIIVLGFTLYRKKVGKK